MRKFLNDFIDTLTYRSKQRAAFILDEAKVEKIQLGAIAQKLSEQGLYANLQLAEDAVQGTIKSSVTSLSFRDAQLRMEELYRTANNVSLLLNSNAVSLNTDIQALNNELTSLEKAVDNYSFLLSDNASYDYSYIETFSDERGREDDFDFLYTDRAGMYFAADENNLVDTQEGTLVMPQEVTRTYPLVGSVIENNYAAFTTSATPLAEALNTNSTTGWRVALSTPSPLTATIPSFTRVYPNMTDFPGANALLEFYLPTPSPCDSLKLSAFADFPIEIVQVELCYDMEEVRKNNLLDYPVSLDSTRTFYFPLQPVAKFKVYVRQFEYRRNGLEPLRSEVAYKKIQPIGSDLNAVIRSRKPKTTQQDVKYANNFTRLIGNFFFSRNRNYNVALSPTLYSPNWGTSREELLKAISPHRRSFLRWQQRTPRSSVAEEALRNALPGSWVDNFWPHITRRGPDGSNDIKSIPEVTDPMFAKGTIENHHRFIKPQAFQYEYNIGFKSIEIGNGLKGFKGVYISSIVPSTSDVGEVRIKTSETQYSESPTTKDQPLVTSVEYSVSNQARPDTEQDWVPILPVGSTNRIVAERFLPDAIGKGFFRFPASLESDVILYKNGYKVVDIDINQYFIRSQTGQMAVGIKLPSGYATTQDIFTVDYVTAVDGSIVNFEKAGYEVPPLVLSFDEDGAGEGFESTYGQLIIDLAYEPFVDYSQVDGSTYIENYGLTPYNPVAVIFDDGTVAINLTNYKGGTQSPLNASSTTTFIQNGASLMFNKPIDQAFRVYYQYLPNNLRFRVVMRSNTNEFVSPKVDYVQIKAKTRKADARKNS